jgi:hypothetical protein
MTDSENIRSGIIQTLRLIASPEAQLDYQKRLAEIDVATELFSQWEDWYHPYSIAFQDAFTERELSALAAFHGRFETICQNTPQILPKLAEFMQTKEWRDYQHAATVALQNLEPKT